MPVQRWEGSRDQEPECCKPGEALMLAAVVASATLGIVPSHASADSVVCKQNYQFVPTKLHAIDIEDWWDSHDDIELTAPWWSYRTSIGTRQVLWNEDMPDSPAFARVPGSTFAIMLYERDGTNRRSLGIGNVTATEHAGGRSFYVSGDYSYALEFFVDDVGFAGCEQLYTVVNTINCDADYAYARLGRALHGDGRPGGELRQSGAGR